MRYSKRRLDSSANERCREEVIADQVLNVSVNGRKGGGRGMLIDKIKEQILLNNYIITFHAHRRMDERGISTEDLVNLILDGSIIEDYPDSRPCPSALIAGRAGWRYCHAVVALCENHLRIITVYWPEDGEWKDNMTRRLS